MRRAGIGLVILFLVAPLLVIAAVSVNEKKRLLFPPHGFSLSWYGAIVAESEWLDPVLRSLGIAAMAAAVAVSIALPLAYFLWRYRVFYAKALFAIGLIPFALPPVITALGYLIFWSSSGWSGTMANVVLSHGVFLVTLPLVTVSLGFEGLDPALTEAAGTMGADDLQVLRTIVLPLILPYMVSGYAFAFVISLNEYIVAFMVAGFTVETLPIKLFNSLRYGYTPVMASVTVVFVALAALIFGLVARFGDLPRLLGALGPRER
ncbi:MAG: ABC transporter permease [Alphaproteobacteria bacterium]|nr:ABC transporter permease [Alphaproteobacteria bacterium]